MSVINAIGVFLFLVLMVSQLYFLPNYFRRLRFLAVYLSREHPAEFLKLQEPAVVADMTPYRLYYVALFMLRREHRKLGDAELGRLGDSALRAFVQTMTVMGGLALSLAFVAL